MWVRGFCASFLSHQYTIRFNFPSPHPSQIPSRTGQNCCYLIFHPDDDSNAITLSNSRAAKTTWTLLIYLSNCVGGETVFYPSKSKQETEGEMVVQPEVGMALLHKHGQECLLHEGRVGEVGH